MALKDSDVNFFRPLWIRLLTTGVVVVWFLVETIFGHDMLWIGITAAGIVYCVWNFFLKFPKGSPATPPGEQPPTA